MPTADEVELKDHGRRGLFGGSLAKIGSFKRPGSFKVRRPSWDPGNKEKKEAKPEERTGERVPVNSMEVREKKVGEGEGVESSGVPLAASDTTSLSCLGRRC